MDTEVSRQFWAFFPGEAAGCYDGIGTGAAFTMSIVLFSGGAILLPLSTGPVLCAAGGRFSGGGMVFGRFPKVGADGVRAVVTDDPRGALDAFQRVEADAGGFTRVPA